MNALRVTACVSLSTGTSNAVLSAVGQILLLICDVELVHIVSTANLAEAINSSRGSRSAVTQEQFRVLASQVLQMHEVS